MSSPPLFKNRQEAGARLAQAIVSHAPTPPVIVYALPRGGLPVAEPIARRLECPLDVVVAKKVTEPKNPELAVGAVTADGHVLWGNQIPWHADPDLWRIALHRAQKKAQTQFTQLAARCPRLSCTGVTAILVDDGIATGMTMAVAAQALREEHPAEIWICAPVAPPGLMQTLHQWAAQVVVLKPQTILKRQPLYQEFPQVEIAEARACLLQMG